MKKLNMVLAKFIWNNYVDNKHMHWVGWKHMALPISEGGIGLRDFKEVAEAFRAKKFWSIVHNNSMWANLIRSNYVKSQNIWEDSTWKKSVYSAGNLTASMELVRDNSQIFVGNGCNTDFWWDNWRGNSSIANEFNISPPETPLVDLLNNNALDNDLIHQLV